MAGGYCGFYNSGGGNVSADIDMVRDRSHRRAYSDYVRRRFLRADGGVSGDIDTSADTAATGFDEAYKEAGFQEQCRQSYRQKHTCNAGGEQYKGYRTGKSERNGMDGTK